MPYCGDEQHTVPAFDKERLSWLAVPCFFIGLGSAAGEMGACNKLRRPAVNRCYATHTRSLGLSTDECVFQQHNHVIAKRFLKARTPVPRRGRRDSSER